MASADPTRGGCRMRCSIRFDIQPLVPPPPRRTLVGQSLPRARGRWRAAPDEVPAKRQFSAVSLPAHVSSALSRLRRDARCKGFACIRFPLAGDAKRNQGIHQCLHWFMHMPPACADIIRIPTAWQKSPAPFGGRAFLYNLYTKDAVILRFLEVDIVKGDQEGGFHVQYLCRANMITKRTYLK